MMLFCDSGWRVAVRWWRPRGARPPARREHLARSTTAWSVEPPAPGEAGRDATLYNYRRRRRRSLLAVSARIGELAHTGARRRRSAAPLARDLDSLVAAAGRAPAASRQL